MKVLVLTDCPSPYQVELFNEIESQGDCSLEVAYLRSRDPDRQWKSAEIRHAAIELDGSGDEIARARGVCACCGSGCVQLLPSRKCGAVDW